MAYSGTLCTEAEADLAIGQNPSTAQTLEANLNIWVGWAQADMEKAFGDKIDLVVNFEIITTAWKPWLAMVCSFRTAFYAIHQEQGNWPLAITQSKLNVCDSIWIGFLSDLKENNYEIIAGMGL